MKLRLLLIALPVAFGLAVFATTYGREMHREKQLMQYLGEREKKKADMEDQLNRRRQRAAFLKTPEGQAWTARDQLNMALPGEKIFRFDSGKKDESPLPAAQDSLIIP